MRLAAAWHVKTFRRLRACLVAETSCCAAGRAWMGKGVSKAVENINTHLGPALKVPLKPTLYVWVALASVQSIWLDKGTSPLWLLSSTPSAAVSPFAITLLPDSVRKSPSSRCTFALPNAQIARTPQGLCQREAVQCCPLMLQACHSHSRHIGFALLHATLFPWKRQEHLEHPS